MLSDKDVWEYANTIKGAPLGEIEDERARCVECGATVWLERVLECYQQAIEPECGHSWMMYQFDGQYVLG